MTVDFSKYAASNTGAPAAGGVDFSKYAAAGSQPTDAAPEPKKKGAFRKVADFFTSSTQNLANTFGTAMAAPYANKLQEESTARQMQLDDQIAKRMRDPNISREDKERLLKMSQENRPDAIIDSNADFQKTGKQVAGEALGTVGEIASFGTFGSGAKAVKGTIAARQGLKTIIKEGAKEGLKYGTVFGAQKGASESMQRNESAGDIVKNTLTGAATGAAAGTVFGAAVPAVIGGVSNKFASRAAQKAEEASMLANKIPDAQVATKALDETGKVVTDKVAKEAVRQGIPEADVALIKGGSEADKIKMNKMLDVRKSQLTNKRVTDRATDVVGDTFMEKIAKPLQATNKKAAQRLEVVAKSLGGKKVDASSALTQFSDDLENAGIKVRKNGTLNFKGSDYEGLTSAQGAIKNVWNRAVRVAKSGDALQLHRAKRYIDEVVEYGKAAEGLSGRAQTLLKKFRHNADAILDSNFSAYNKANTVYAETIGELHKIGEAMGKRFKIGDNFADARAGLVLRRILSNTQSRSDVLQLLESAQSVARKYGAKIDEDVITQANFADVLEKMLGSEAPTSFLGQTERAMGGAEKAAGAAADFAEGKVVKGTLKAGKYLIDITRGINEENKMNALRELIKLQAKKTGRTVFGKAK